MLLRMGEGEGGLNRLQALGGKLQQDQGQALDQIGFLDAGI